MKYGARTDANHQQVVATLRAVGAYVVDLSAVGGGVPDLLVGFRGRWVLAEIKNPRRPPSRQRLRESQAEFHAVCLARGLPCVTVNSPQAAVRMLQVLVEQP